MPTVTGALLESPPRFRPLAALRYNHPMDTSRQFFYSCLLGFAILAAPPLPAATVYKTVDANGVVSYSDIAPQGDVAVETLVIDAAAPQLTETEQQRLEAMRETTDRMVADRQQREKHRAVLRKEQEQQQARYYPQPVYPGNVGYSGSYPVYVPYRVRRPGRGWGKPRPVHPIARPPLRGAAPGQHTWSTTSLPRSNYPASLIRKSYSPQVRAAFER